MSNLHVRYEGQSRDIPFEEIFTAERLTGIGVEGDLNVNELTPAQIKMAVAQHYDVALSEFDGFQVEFHKTGNVTLRPDAVFG